MAMSKQNGTDAQSGLFGIEHSNRTAGKHWGKNCFNSSFPTAVACYMLAHGIPAIYNRLERVGEELCVVSSEVSMREVFNCGCLAANGLNFRFESRFEPYQQY
jgi:hypothetical protein